MPILQKVLFFDWGESFQKQQVNVWYADGMLGVNSTIIVQALSQHTQSNQECDCARTQGHAGRNALDEETANK